MTYAGKEPNGKIGTRDPIYITTKGTTFSDRLRIAIGERSIRAFAGESGISYGAMHKYFAGTTQPTLDNLVILARTTGVSLEWLATGEGSPVKEAQSVANTALSSSTSDVLGNEIDLSEFVFVPRYNVTAAAGHGAWNEEENPMFAVSFRRYWIINHLKADPKRLSVISVFGDSMEGVLNDKDIILINHDDNDPREGIYVLRIDGQLIVKRVQRLPGAQLRITSTNTAYEPFLVNLMKVPSDFEVIGRVVWFGRAI